jgi:glycopeptide antibiotics resistance protein
MTRRSSALVGGAATAVCLAGVATLALVPYSWQLNRLTVRLYELFRTDLPLAPVWVTPDDYGKLLNILLFVPLGAALAWWLGRQWGWALPVAVTLSVGIEIVQRVPALGRVSSLEDVACNVVGATAGVVVVAFLRAWRLVRRSESVDE